MPERAPQGSAPSRIRTCGLLLRRESLYPAELSGLVSHYGLPMRFPDTGFMRGLLPSAHTDGGRWGRRASLPREGEDNMGKRFALLISVSVAGVMAQGAQTVMALVKR